MGMISRVWCGECGYSEHFRSGIGMRHGSLDRCISEFPYWERQKLESLREEKALSDYHFSFVLAQCQTCLNLMDKPFIEFQFQNGSREHSGMCCTYCESESVRLIHEDRLDAARCPYCKEKSLEQQLEGMWD
ncbi:hypothetical protein [Salimicrobium halophilum]|uniref:Uncharacterized protein n=1 Tax=Salimicrobium halophilum TaxID=86666 RepID=A0A1G8T6A4_9BACI|nr:hypothetical protein [Salimicrobium halophilum]SDJ37092.1 hypothetical protein SAMN04490247_1731 [Salimicrobium halophilum]